ncbi:MAG TPA: hypothetical protein EYQ14_01085 [Gammaproteobacteria bacterium]|nr:hypothetical protein [Gammaproteobacteria bacterium]
MVFVLPDTIDRSPPTEEERGHFYIRRMLGAHGFASERQIAYDHIAVNRFSDYNIRPAIRQALADLLESAEIQQVDFCNEPYFYLVHALSDCPVKLGQRRVNFLSPFDNLVINRKRLLDLFGFDYQLECYVPQAKRKFGYFVLPILYGDELVGRMDCKAIRKEKTLSIRNIWLEPKTKLTEAFVTALALALQEYQTSLQCEQIIINKSEPAKLSGLIQ